MRIAYYDEAGDDGVPGSSPVFVLGGMYMHYLHWQGNYDRIQRFRKHLKERYGFPVKLEIHSKELLLNKNPYRDFGITDEHRVAIIGECCDMIASLDARLLNIAIVKAHIRRADYPVLDKAVTYSVQRIENDLRVKFQPNERFLIITDNGRVGKMRATTRRIQKINFIPSKFAEGSYRQEIRTLIEDPLPKDSKESHFIQLVDVVSNIVYLYVVATQGVGAFPNRMPKMVDHAMVHQWMDRLRPVLNIQASTADPYGVVMYPRST
ncbi:MAG TPA: DUF3800 domain-containing protein [Flavobacteriales bacterium]|nr:DUF3800 domain-containing protein [Flavobacteriales bacterium]HNU55955.1 DUF3800 domain-containing protein [Flavobacteriales bacterium]